MFKRYVPCTGRACVTRMGMNWCVDPSHLYAEWCGHTLGFTAAGSLSVHTTVAVWNAHHIWELRVQHMKSICEIETFLLCAGFLMQWEKNRQKSANLEIKFQFLTLWEYWSWEANKQLSSGMCGGSNFLSSYPWRFVLSSFEYVRVWRRSTVREKKMY